MPRPIGHCVLASFEVRSGDSAHGLVLLSCYCYAMARVRISTTVSDDLLEQARAALPTLNNASLLDRALAALCAEHLAAEIDRSYEAYDALPIDTEDEWGNLADFLDSAGVA